MSNVKPDPKFKASRMLSIDLHGMSVKDAVKAVQNTFQIAIEQGHHEIYFVTGYGSHVNANGSKGVLKKILPALFTPFKDLILKIDKEAAAYKITFKKTPTEKQKFFERFSQTDFFKLVTANIEQEAKSGNLDSKLALAAFYLSSYYKDDNKIIEALKILETEESKGCAQAGVLLAEILLEGTKVPRDPQKAKKLLEKHADKNKDAKYMLAKTILQGEGTIRDDERGKTLMLELADTNYAPACCSVGQSYLSADYTQRNEELGVKYLQRAAVQDYPYAFVDLARCYGSGQGIKQNIKLALHYYGEAAKLNNPYALYQMGRYHMIGKGVPVNNEIAFSYFLKAAQLEDGDAQGMVGIFYCLGLGTASDKAEGLRWLKRAADKNHPEGCYLMGCLLLEGQFISPDVPQALKYLRVAAKAKHPLAMFALAITLLSHQHTSEEKKQAFELLKISCTLDPSVDPTDVIKKLIKKSHYMAGMFFEAPKLVGLQTGETDLFPVGLLSLAIEYTQQKNIALALLFATHAAELDHTDSQWFLVRTYLFEKPPGMPQDEQTGFHYLQKLVAKKEPEAIYILAIAYAQGLFGLTEDKRQAMYLMVQAAQKRWPAAIKFLQVLHQDNFKKEESLPKVEKTSVPTPQIQPTISNESKATRMPFLSRYQVFAAAVGLAGITCAFIYKHYKP
jgi:TPR repeat protein